MLNNATIDDRNFQFASLFSRHVCIMNPGTRICFILQYLRLSPYKQVDGVGHICGSQPIPCIRQSTNSSPRWASRFQYLSCFRIFNWSKASGYQIYLKQHSKFALIIIQFLTVFDPWTKLEHAWYCLPIISTGKSCTKPSRL